MDRINNYLVVTIKDWNMNNYNIIKKEISGNWHLIYKKDDLTFENVNEINPKYIFFPHWSWLIPKKIYSNFECIVFHMTDLPFGRGGSPLQNLILLGIYNTKISAIKVIKELDAGPIYLKKDLSLYGSAEEIYLRASDITFNMIKYIIENNPSPVNQEGKPTIFSRRKPRESKISDVADLNRVFDWIRMLDADGYPKAFIEMKNLKIEFSHASLKNKYIIADVKIKPKK